MQNIFLCVKYRSIILVCPSLEPKDKVDPEQYWTTPYLNRNHPQELQYIVKPRPLHPFYPIVMVGKDIS